MKRVVLIFIVIILSFFTTSLALDNPNKESIKCIITIPTLNLKKLSNLPKDYPPKEAIKNGDVVFDQIFYYNVDLLDNFIENFEKNNLHPNEMVRITSYTVEGSPIIKDLIFTNNILTLKVDQSRNFYFNPENLIIKKYEIKRIYTLIIKDTIFYMAETTSGEKIPIVIFTKN